MSLAFSMFTLKWLKTAWFKLFEFSFSNKNIASLTVIDESYLYFDKISSLDVIVSCVSNVILLFLNYQQVGKGQDS